MGANYDSICPTFLLEISDTVHLVINLVSAGKSHPEFPKVYIYKWACYLHLSKWMSSQFSFFLKNIKRHALSRQVTGNAKKNSNLTLWVSAVPPSTAVPQQILFVAHCIKFGVVVEKQDIMLGHMGVELCSVNQWLNSAIVVCHHRFTMWWFICEIYFLQIFSQLVIFMVSSHKKCCCHTNI